MAPATLHRYMYAGASPVSFYDPSGLMTMIELSQTTFMQNVLSGMRLAFRLMNLVDKVQGTIQFVNALTTMKSSLPVMTSILAGLSQVAKKDDIITDPHFFEMAYTSLLSNISRVGKGLFKYHKDGVSKAYKNLGKKNFAWGIWTPLPEGLSLGNLALPLPKFKIGDQKVKVNIGGPKGSGGRVFGMGYTVSKKQDQQMIRLDYHSQINHIKSDGSWRNGKKDFDSWPADDYFHYHIPRN